MANALASITTQITFFGNLLLAALRPRLALVGRIDTNTYPGVVSAPGQIISIPALTIAGAMQDRDIGGGANVGSAASRNVNILLHQGTFTVPLDNLQQTFTNIALLQETAVRMAIIAANYVDSKLTTLYTKIPYAVGNTAGTAIFNSSDKMNALNLARLQLMRNLAPMDRLRALINPSEASNIRALDLYNQAQQAGQTAARTNGSFFDIYGINIWESQNAPTNITLSTTANWSTPLVDASAVTPAIGDVTLVVKGLGATQTIKAGSIFTVGVDSFGQPIPYSVTTNTISTSGGGATLPISPALKTAPADGATITPRLYTAAGSQGLVYDPSVIQLVIRPQADFVGPAVLTQVFTDPESGVSFRLHLESNVAQQEAAGAAYVTKLTMDILCGAECLRPEFGVRLEGQI